MTLNWYTRTFKSPTLIAALMCIQWTVIFVLSAMAMWLTYGLALVIPFFVIAFCNLRKIIKSHLDKNDPKFWD